MMGKRVVVLTHRPIAGTHGETAFAGPLDELVETLGREGCRSIYLDGGSAVRQGLRAGLVDELTLSWVPVTLGSGIPLFGPEVPRVAWKAARSRAFASGLVQATYVPVRGDQP
jgi:dihydrofolate reductase